MIVVPPTVSQVAGHASKMYADDLAEDGFVHDHTRAMALSPEAHAAFEQLAQSLVASLGLRLYELVTLAASGAIGSAHCRLAHGRAVLRTGVLEEDQLHQVARDFTDAGLSPAEVAAMQFAVRLSTASDSMGDEDSSELRRLGYDDRQIVDIALTAGARNYYSRTLQALAVPVGPVPGLEPGLREALLAR